MYSHGECHGVGVGGFYLHGGVHRSLTPYVGLGNATLLRMQARAAPTRAAPTRAAPTRAAPTRAAPSCQAKLAPRCPARTAWATWHWPLVTVTPSDSRHAQSMRRRNADACRTQPSRQRV
jgi:hypothetical protein